MGLGRPRLSFAPFAMIIVFYARYSVHFCAHYSAYHLPCPEDML